MRVTAGGQLGGGGDGGGAYVQLFIAAAALRVSAASQSASQSVMQASVPCSFVRPSVFTRSKNECLSSLPLPLSLSPLQPVSHTAVLVQSRPPSLPGKRVQRAFNLSLTLARPGRDGREGRSKNVESDPAISTSTLSDRIGCFSVSASPRRPFCGKGGAEL